MQTPRIWSFGTLTNWLALIGCRPQVGRNAGLVEGGDAWRRCAFPGV